MTLNLLDGTTVDSGEVNWDKSTYHFYDANTGVDITNLITRSDKIINFPGFDGTVDNDRIYREQQVQQTGKDPGPPLNTSVGSLFVQNVGQTLSNIGTGAGQTVKDTLQTFVIFGIAGFVAYQLLKK